MSDPVKEAVERLQTKIELAVDGVPVLHEVFRADLRTTLSELSRLSRLVEEAGEDGWRPIETAPEDGTYILGCQRPDEPEKGWHKSWEQWKAPMTVAFRAYHPNAPGKQQWRDCKGSPAQPTHWRPMLPPPRASLAHKAISGGGE